MRSHRLASLRSAGPGRIRTRAGFGTGAGRLNRGRGRVVGALVTVLLLGGCLGIRPDDSVRTGLTVEEPLPDPVYFLPSGPASGDSPSAIITGFLHADEVTAERLSVAQSFLTKALVGTWDPGVATKVIDPAGTLRVDDKGGGWYAVSAPLVATIDSDGRAHSAPPKTSAKVSMHLVQVDGEWRVDRTDDDFGRWVRTTSLDQVLRPVPLYYPTSVGRSLVPDVRWLPVTSLATGLTRALLGQPPTYLGDAVRTGLGDARLSVVAVSVRGGIATVPLVAAAAYNDTRTRTDIWGQLVQTLTQSPSISGVVVTVDGAPLAAANAVPPVLSAEELGFRDLGAATGVNPVVRFGKEVFSTDLDRLLRSEVDPVDRTSDFPAIPTAWTGLALSFTGEELAAVGRDGTGMARYRNGQSVEAEGFARNLTDPTYDRFGVIWVGGTPYDGKSAARLWTVDSNEEPFDASVPARPVLVSWLVDRLPLAVAVSVDGARIAVVSTDDKGRAARLDVAGVGRDAAGSPTAVSSMAMQLGATLDHIRDVVWTSPTELAVLAGRDTKALPYLVTLGDEITALAPIDRAQSITTLGGSRNLAITSDQGHVFVRAGDHWQALPPSASELIAPAR